MWLLDFNLQPKVTLSNFSDKEFVILKSPIFKKFWSDDSTEGDIYRYLISFDYQRTKLKVSHLCLKAEITSGVLSLTTKGVLSSA